MTWGDWFALVVDDEDDYAGWLGRLAGDLMIPPWEIPQRLGVPQTYGLFAGEAAAVDGMSHAETVELINRRRARKGLPPLTDGLPSCATPPPPGWTPPADGR